MMTGFVITAVVAPPHDRVVTCRHGVAWIAGTIAAQVVVERDLFGREKWWRFKVT